MSKEKIYIFDTTLRDGQQTTGVNFSVSDKMTIAKSLDELGVDYIEGGWPGANPTDNDFFSRDLSFSKSKFTAFGMTRRPGRSADNDPSLNALVNSNASTICLVGKSSSFQVKSALGISEDENLLMLEDSFNYLNSKNKESIYDAEHFFDGFKNNKDLSILFSNFKKKLDALNKKKYVVAVSGGSDSLALVALTKSYTFFKKTKF